MDGRNNINVFRNEFFKKKFDQKNMDFSFWMKPFSKRFLLNVFRNSKGQIFLIIGIVIALSLILIYVNTNFDVALKKKGLYIGEKEDKTFTNLQNEFRESFDIAVKKGGYPQLNNTMRNFTLFMNKMLKTRDVDVLYSISTYDDTELKVSVWNFLEKNIKDVNISQNLTGGTYSCGDIPDEGNCYNSWSVSGKTGDYHINVTYGDNTKTYEGWTGPKGNYSAVFYRLEYDGKETQLSDEDAAKSKPV